ncbi:RNA-directed RNA polymerase [Aureobasidium subglaciale]|nr:RNA-directed RNA polymerase [Aureobasidium subglaciale]
MEVFINSIPAHCTERDLKRFLRSPLAEFDITDFVCEKLGSKACAKLIFLDTDKGKRFLKKYGKSVGQRAPLSQLSMNGHRINLAESRDKPDEWLIRSLKSKAAQPGATMQSRPATHRNATSSFEISHLRCGVWSFVDGELTFVQHFINSRRGRVLFGHRQLAILYNDASGHDDQSASRIDINYFDIDTATTGSYKDPTLTFGLQFVPRFYRNSTVDIAELMARVGLWAGAGAKWQPQKQRVTSINRAHSEVVGTSFVYQIQLADYRQLREVSHFLRNNRHTSSMTISHSTPTLSPSNSLTTSFKRLDTILSTMYPYNSSPFDVKFQVLRLARNGALPPDRVFEILPTIELLKVNHDRAAIVESLKRVYQGLHALGPHSEAELYSVSTITNNLLDYAQEYDRSKLQNPYELVNRHAHIVLVHKLTVTVSGVYLEGPEPEVSNRVLREYQDHSDHFTRVTFVDEDGEPVHFDSQSDQTAIYSRFRKFMESEYLIAGRGYSFLGFSHSSLRSQTCWFMAPFEYQGRTLRAPELIRNLGDFSHIRTPARCAARIGQAFTDTTGTVQVEAGVLGRLPDVERNGRCFSDGCGTISLDLLRQVWRVYGSRRTVKPVILQIRFAGSKGVVSLDSRLDEEQFNVRPSMEKFIGSGSITLEHGQRDLPSQLSGGDLDGDLYNVIFEPSLMPRREVAPPADYPRVPGRELDREVTTQDMSNFFVEFMETDQLGQICTRHLQLADQREAGVFDDDCVQLASMASTAVDFSKTGISVSMINAPRAHRAKPDFMAPSPRVIVESGGFASFEDAVENDEDQENDPFGDLDGIRPMRYYRSDKALGHLYRAIDEHQFLKNMQDATKLILDHEDNLLSILWTYVHQHTEIIQWSHHLDLARQIRDGYEQALLQSLYQFASSPHYPLTETEIFSGTILGRDGSKQSKRLREATQTMRQQLEDVLTFTISRIIDGDYDDNDRNEEALPRAIACLAVGMDEPALGDKKVGELQSWKYISAGVCLREIKRWYAIDMGRHTLPRARGS